MECCCQVGVAFDTQQLHLMCYIEHSAQRPNDSSLFSLWSLDGFKGLHGWDKLNVFDECAHISPAFIKEVSL